MSPENETVMGGELVKTEGSWLEVVKAAINAEQQVDEELHLYPNIIYPTWIDQPEDLNNKTFSESGISDLLRPLALKSNEDASSTENQEQILFNELKNILQQPNTLSKQSFLRFLGSYLRNLKAKRDEFTPAKGKKSSDRRRNGDIEGKDEESTLALLKGYCRHLGQRLIGLILECSLSLSFWAPVQILLERRVVVSNFSSNLVHSLVDAEKSLLLCLYISNVPDLSPMDVYNTLTFFLDSIQAPSRSFLPVKSDWKRLASEEMEKVVRNRDAIQAATSSSMYHNLEKLSRGHDCSISSAIGLVMAIDGFSAPELCIHHLLVAGLDEVVLSNVVSQLSTAQVLNLARYLRKWIQCFSSRLESFPAPKGDRVPSFAQVLGWVGVLLEAHFTQFVLSSDFHSELRAMRDMVQSLVDFSASIIPLGGITEHIKSRSLLPARKQHGGTTSDYVIELLDMS